MMVSIIEIVLYTKPTAEHQYRVLPSSCHPLHTYSLRIRRICSFHDTTYSYYHLHSHKRLNHTYPSSCRIPPSHSLNIIYFSQAHLHSFILLLCLNLYHSLPFYVLSLCRLPVRNQNSRFMLWCYTLFKILYFSAGPSRTSDTGGHLDRV